MNRNKTLRITLIRLFAAVGLVSVLVGCRHDGLNVATLDKVCYEKDIGPLFLRSCGTMNCHDQTSRKGGYAFTDYTSIKKSITPFNAQKSTAYKAITGKGFMQLMPPGGALTQDERILIRVWIDQGGEPTTCTTTGGVIDKLPAENVCFQLDNGKLLASVKGTSIQMPPGYKITSCEFREIELWKANGTTQN